MSFTISLTPAEQEMLRRITEDLYGQRSQMRSAVVATLVRERFIALFGREAVLILEGKKEVGSDELPEQTETEQESP